jgi:hypothetical protein
VKSSEGKVDESVDTVARNGFGWNHESGTKEERGTNTLTSEETCRLLAMKLPDILGFGLDISFWNVVFIVEVLLFC